MSKWKLSSWLYPLPTGDPGRDRNARTVQFSSLLLISTVSVLVAINLITGDLREALFLAFAVVGLSAAMVMSRVGKWEWAARIALSSLLFAATLLVFEARDGFRSNAMLLFPAMLLLSLILLDRASYLIAAGFVLVVVALEGIAERQGLTQAIPGVRSPTTYESIFFVELFLLVLAVIGSRVSRDAESNVFDLRAMIDRLSERNLELKEIADALRKSQQELVSVYNAVRDPIFHLAVEPEGQFRFVSVNASFLRVTGLSLEMVAGKTVNEVIPEPSLTMVLRKYRQAVEQKGAAQWEETSDYPTGRLTGVVSIVPLINGEGTCTQLVGSVHDITERKRAEAALRESEERFRNLADTAPVLIWVSGPDRLCTFFNKPWLNFTGRTIEQELGNGWVSGLHPEDLDRCLATYTSSFDAREPFQMEYRLRRADGVYRWLLDKGTPRYGGTEFVGYIGSCTDITELKSTEERLRAQEIQFKEAQRLAHVGSWERNIEADTTYWSDEMIRILGLQNHAPSKFTAFLDYVHPKDRSRTTDAHSQVESTRGTVEVAYRIVRPDEEVRFVRSTMESISSDQGTAAHIVGAVQDVTEQVRAQELVRLSEERLKNAERLANVGNWQWDLETDEVSWSEGMFRILSQPRDFIPSYEGFLQAVIPQHRERLRRDLRDALAEQSGLSGEVQIARPNGDLRNISFVAEPLLDEEGSLKGMFGATQDITDLRHAQAADLARQKLESIGTLAGGIAHDFNNVLGGVVVQAEVALLGLPTGANPEEELKAIRDVALRGAEIVRQLLTYSGRQSAVVEPVDVSNVIKEMLALLKVSVPKNAVLEVQLAQNLPLILANVAQLQQIVMNLVTNASDAAGDRDGEIRVTTVGVKIDADSWAISQGLEEGDYVQVEVSDTGCGMPPEIQARVFDPFFTTKSAGHGLGLSIVHGIVHSLGGAIHLASETGKGTTFQVLLPCADAAVSDIREMTSGSGDLSDIAQHATVLVVEDESPLRQAVVKALRQIGFEVFETADGTAAIQLIREHAGNIDLILLDMTIPGASSREVIAESELAWKDTKIILTSAYSQEMLADCFSAPQVRNFIRKPFQLADLAKTIRSALSE